MNKDGKLSLAVKCGCHCKYSNENRLTMAIKKQHQKIDPLQSFYCAI